MNFALRIPDYYREDIESLKGDVSINQFILSAISEKIASLKTEEYLRQRASKGSREHAIAMLTGAPDTQPNDEDKIDFL